MRKLALFLASLLLSLLIFEIGVRWANLDYNPNPNWRFHPRLGWTQEKDAQFEVPMASGTIQVEFNRLGFRDIEHDVEKPPGTRRLVNLGDSFSEAIQVNLEETYWWRLGELLSEQTGQNWEVINLGVGDWGNAQALLALETYGFRYQPDLVLSQVFPLNDICNNTLELAHLCKSQNDNYRPYLVRGDEGLELTWTQPLRQFLRSNLVSFGVLERILLEVTTGEETGTVDEVHLRRSRERGFQADPLLLTYAAEQRQPPAIRKGWETTEAVLQATYERCEERGIPWAAVVIPFEARISESWSGLAASMPSYELSVDYPERRLTQFFRSIEAPALMLKPFFDQNKDAVLPYIGGHLNAQAHELTAQVLADFLIRNGLTEERKRSAARSR